MQGLPNHGSVETSGQAREEKSGRLLTLLAALDKELHPSRPDRLSITLDSSLERDLGIDSLAKVELLSRLERTFEVGISEQAFTAAETVRDLLELILSSSERQAGIPREVFHLPEAEPGIRLPAQAKTLPEVLTWHCEQHPERTHLLLYEGEQVSPISYRELYDRAQAVARGLSTHGLQPGQAVAIMLPTSQDYFISFFGILFAGAIPVPIYPPARLSQIEDHLRRHALILDNAACRMLITSKEIAPVARLLQAQVTSLHAVVTTKNLMKAADAEPLLQPQSQDIAFLQYTSGSTGNPKGVKLSHFNLLANIRAMGETLKVNDNDVFVSWLPLYHDMGLIGAWLGSLYHASPLVIMSPLAFLSRPHRWLWAIHQHHGTLSAAPNFAYELCLSKVDDSAIEGLDLSSWRMAFNGAEPVSPKTIQRFTKRFAAYGFRPEAMMPVYGLAESSVGLAFPPIGRSPLIDRIRRDVMDRDDAAQVVSDSDPGALEVVACGQPMRGHQIRIVDDQGRELPERKVGHLQFQGPSSTSGYFQNPEATEKLFDGPWLNSGDLAYIAAGDIYLTSRVKDIIIRAGRNIYPHELEEAVGDIEGIRKGCVAVFGSKEQKSGTERLIVLAETRTSDRTVQQQLRQRITAVTTDLIGIPADEVVLTPPRSVLKTSSGKIRRAATRERYEQRQLNQRHRSLWLQFARLALSSLKPQWRRLTRNLVDYAYAAYAWCLFALMAPVVWLLVALIPKIEWRWQVIRNSARLIMTLSGVKLLVQGVENLNIDQPTILVANHASYLDGLLLVAALPGRFLFVAKRELLSRLIPRVFLRSIGTMFVERFDRQRSQDDLAQLSHSASGGNSLLFFPEGTFTRIPGLRPFRMGAFAAAIENDLPVSPITLKGSRSLLRAGSWFPRRVMITVIVAPQVKGVGKDWKAMLCLRDKVRSEILKWSGEPDLPGETSVPRH